MAESPAHVLGEAIGLVLEEAVGPLLQELSDECGLYLDCKGPRPCRTGRAVAWTDKFGNTHELDFVLEAGGTDSRQGRPVAFIECAWRRYTKHSRNKAQEIQGAVGPLAETYEHDSPFLGVVLAGDFTDNAVAQLRSHGFAVIHFPYESVVRAFEAVGHDVSYEEDTPVSVLSRKARRWKGIAPSRKPGVVRQIARLLVQSNQEAVDGFRAAIRATASRRVRTVRVLPLHGDPFDAPSVPDAIRFIESYAPDGRELALCKYEVAVTYTNGDKVEGEFERTEDAVQFLRLIGACA
jgi:hypothetical protein